MKRGDLVRTAGPNRHIFEDRLGVIIKWARTGGPKGTVWEVLYPDGTEYWDENDLEIINESR